MIEAVSLIKSCKILVFCPHHPPFGNILPSSLLDSPPLVSSELLQYSQTIKLWPPVCDSRNSVCIRAAEYQHISNVEDFCLDSGEQTPVPQCHERSISTLCDVNNDVSFTFLSICCRWFDSCDNQSVNYVVI